MLPAKVLSWIIALLGLWEFGDIIAFLIPGFGHVSIFVWNHIIVCIVLVLIGACGALTSKARTATVQHGMAAIGGVWLMIVRFVLGRPLSGAGLWNDVIVGLMVLILAVWGVRARPRIPS